MPPKKKDKKKKKPAVSITGEPADKVVGRFLKSYEKCCAQFSPDSVPSPIIKASLKQAIEDEKFLTKLVLDALPLNRIDDPKVYLEPLLSALRRERYNYIKDLHIWDVPLTNKEITAMALLLEKSIYDIRCIDFMDNMIEPYGMRRFGQALPFASRTLVSISLDYNEFSDEGCLYLCDALLGNETLLQLSMNFCRLTAKCAPRLGAIIATTAIRDLFLDGNDLCCDGAEALIMPLVEKAEREIAEQKQIEEAKRKAEEDALLEDDEARANRFNTLAGGESTPQDKPGSAGIAEKTKKKKKKGKKKKEPAPPPAPGAWIHKLHLADNGIDALSQTYGDFLPIRCMKAFRRLITNSSCLQELDLEDNLIGDMGGNELVEGLTERKEANDLPGIKLRTTHRMRTETLKDLCKLGVGAIKKKKKKGGKKKKK